MPQISVIVPVYKVEDCLGFCVDSILNQSFTDFELILIDDGSPDNCGAICDEYAAKDNRVRVIHRENGGLSAARNSGMDIAEGEYITFIDSDDAVRKNCLEQMLNILGDSDVAVCGFSEFEDGAQADTSVAEVGKVVPGDGKSLCADVYGGVIPVNAWGKLFRSSLIRGMRFPEGRIHEDQAFVPIACYEAAKTVRTDGKLYLYRVRPESITRSKFTLKRYDDIWAIDRCIEFFEEKDENEIAEAAKNKRKKLLCVYAIYAKRDGVRVPKEYRVGIAAALKYLENTVSFEKFTYYLGQLNINYVYCYRYMKSAKKKLNCVFGGGK